MARNGMTWHQQEQLLDAVMYYVTPDIRRKVMREVPLAYNAYCGQEIVVVQQVSATREV